MTFYLLHFSSIRRTFLLLYNELLAFVMGAKRTKRSGTMQQQQQQQKYQLTKNVYPRRNTHCLSTL